MDLTELFSIYEKEKKNPNKLFRLPEGFYKKISDMIRKYKKLLEIGSYDSEEHKRLILELDNLREIIKNILDIRLEKLIRLALFEVKENIKVAERSDMTKEEQIFFDLITSILSGYFDGVKKKILEGESPDLEEIYKKVQPIIIKKVKKSDKVLVLFNKDFSQIVGPDGKLYGPFNKEDIYALPKEIAERLLSLNVCEKIDIE